jgi:membrane-associated phospholipid phosphatase
MLVIRYLCLKKDAMLIEFNKKNIFRRRSLLLEQIVPFTWIAVSAILISYFFLDKPIALFFHRAPSELKYFSRLFSRLSSPHLYMALLPVLFFYIRFILKKEKRSNRILLLALAVPLANLVTNLLKFIFGRYRPEWLFSQNVYGFDFLSLHREQSFPSGNACTISAVLCGIACFFPKYSYLLLAGAFLISLARVTSTAHYLSDIIAGVYVGMATAQYAYKIMKQQGALF